MLYEGYGMTETAALATTTATLAKRKPGSIGFPVTGTECKIVDLDTGEREMPVGEEGELCLRGPQVMKGYWNKPEETAKTMRDGWLHTGDVARMDEDGYFYIVQRKKDMIIVSGFNVYPNEVEDVLFTHPSVQEAAVIGVPMRIAAKLSKCSSCSNRKRRRRLKNSLSIVAPDLHGIKCLRLSSSPRACRRAP